MTVLAVVGSVKITPEDDRAPLAAALIVEAIERFQPTSIVSGGAVGIDSLAEDIANAYAIPTTIYLPTKAQWAPHGYKERNLLIAKNCTHLLRIAAKEARTYGSGWTADQAEKCGVSVARVTL